MTVAAITMVKDEADIIATTVRNMAEQVDFVIVADNDSTDDTRLILEELSDRFDITIVDDHEVAYHQSVKMTNLAHMAGNRGADWIVPFDADEFWCSRFGPIGKAIEKYVPDTWFAVAADVYDHMVTDRDRSEYDDPVRRMVWRRDEKLPLSKVAGRYRPDMTIRQGNHSIGYSMEPAAFPNVLTVRHYPYRSLEQFIRKVRNGAAAYGAMHRKTIPDGAGEHWRKWGQFTDEQLAEVYMMWYYRENPSQRVVKGDADFPPMTLDPAPIPW